ncbi:MAG: hypothetical protein ACC661_12165 [Verrucomicrobiales bacterium]
MSLLVGEPVSQALRAPVVLNIPRLASAKPGFVDRLIYEGYLREGREMATFEKKSGRLEKALVL